MSLSIEMAAIGFRVIRHGLAFLAVLICVVPGRANNASELVPVAPSQLCVTEGALETLPEARLSVRVAKLRAVLAEPGAQAIEARFTYLGPTMEMAPLRSGEIRQQFGLKLRAADSCNLIYAMWRFAPKPSLIVSIKSNPGLHTSRACGTSGYRFVSPRSLTPVQAPRIGATHRLAAVLDGSALKVFVDGALAWDGELGREALDFDGPVGIRSDNVHLELSLFAPPQTGGHACPTLGGTDVNQTGGETIGVSIRALHHYDATDRPSRPALARDGRDASACGGVACLTTVRPPPSSRI